MGQDRSSAGQESHDLTIPYLRMRADHRPAATDMVSPGSWQAAARNSQKRHRSRFWPLVVVSALALFLAATLAVALALAVWFHSDLIMPGVFIGNVNVGNRSMADAAAALEANWEKQLVLLEGSDSNWMASPDQLGISLDSTATVQLAHLRGRSLRSIEKIVATGRPTPVQPLWSFDRASAESYLLELAPQIAHPAIDASVIIVDGRAEASPPAVGRELDIRATLAVLEQDPDQVLSNRRLHLATASVEPAVTDVSSAVGAANELLANMITINAFDPINGETVRHQLAPESWSSWLNLEIVDAQAGQFSWSVDEQELHNYLMALSASLGPGRYMDLAQAGTTVTRSIEDRTYEGYVRVYHHDRQHIVQVGETLSSIGRDYGVPYPWIQQANPALDSGLFAGQSLTIPSPDTLLPLPVVANKRIVVSLTEQRVRVYQDGELLWEWLASTGINESPTSPGIFQIQSHEPNAYASNWNLWMPHFMGVYRPVPTSDFMNGFHGFPTRNGSTLLWTGDLGHKVTYGCILISSDNAVKLYDWAEEGMVVEIRP